MACRLKIIALLLALPLALSACGAPASPVSQIPLAPAVPAAASAAPMESVRVPWSAQDTLNPFTCQTLQNHYLSGLLYDSLVTLDPVGAPQNRLAQEVVMEGASCIVKLRTDAAFSDGSRVTAQDVIYSAQAARTSPRYAPQLAGVMDATAPDDFTVVFALAAPDVFFPHSLAFPVVKLDTGELPVPVGGGRFVPEAQGSTFGRNPGYYDPVKNIRRVVLVDAGTQEDQSYAVMEKTLDMVYSDLRGETNLGLGTGRRQVVLNNLVFLGVNSRAWGFDSTLRQVFSSLINREEIVRKAYMGFAAAAYSPIKPSFGQGTRTAAVEEMNLEKQNALLDQLGYGTRDSTGYRIIGGRRFSMRLLVNSDNTDRVAAAELVASALHQGGIEVVLDKQPYEVYLQRIAAGEYDLYLGETKISPNLDLLALITPNETFGPGCVWDQHLLDLYAAVKAGTGTLEALDTALGEVMPVVPLVYRRGIVCFSRDFSANIVATEQDIFYNIRDW